ncbi:MAG: MBL fold metallo-hydrolase [Proteobacteria bacterium]|nr:MBL fold metallo-hydrolase [Pseudomonadota bacterium]
MRLKRFQANGKIMVAVCHQSRWIPLNAVKGFSDFGHDMIMILDQWPMIKPKLEKALTDPQETFPDLPQDKKILLPFDPRSFRDFMLSESHAIDAARGIVKRFLPLVYPFLNFYEKVTRYPFPAFKPKAIWYKQPIYYMGSMMHAKWLAGPNRDHTRFGEIPQFKEGLYQLVKDTYAWMVPNGSWGENNIGLIDCQGESVLVDTCWDLKFTKEILDTAGDILKKSPVEYVINTHADGDHFWGNQLFRDKKIIATHACRNQMHHLKPLSLNALKLGDRKIIYAGDLVFLNSTPVIWAGPVENCMKGLKKIMEKDVDIVVPGHGPIATKKDVQLVIDYWEIVQQALYVSCQKGIPPMKAAGDFVLSSAFQGSPFVAWDSPERIVTSAHTMYRHWGAYVTAFPEVIETLRIMRKQAMLAFKMRRARPYVMRHF